MSPYVHTGDAVVVTSASSAPIQHGDLMKDSVTIAPGPTTGTATSVAERESSPFVADGTRDVRTEAETLATGDADETRLSNVERVSTVGGSGLESIPSADADIAMTLLFDDRSAATHSVAVTARENGRQANTDGGN